MHQVSHKQLTWRIAFALCFAMLLIVSLDVLVFAEHDTVYNSKNYARVYDYDYYTTQVHPELAGKSDAAVLKYFVKTGIPKGEQACEGFSVRSYRNANQDLRGSYGKDYAKYIAQYIKKGYRENRTVTGYDQTIKDPVTKYSGKNYNRVYDFQYYISKYPSVRRKYADDDFGALKYFVTKGIKKQHQANEAFNVKWYYNANPNLRYLCGQDWERYYNYYQRKAYRRGAVKPCNALTGIITYYKQDGKKINLSSIYDFEYYTKHNSAAYKYWKKQDDAGAIKHFVNYGMFLGLKANAKTSVKSAKYIKLRRQLHPNLNSNAYIKANGYSSRTRWLILVNQEAHMVYVFHGKKGAWTCKNKFPCCVGKPSTPTPTGTFCLGSKGYYFDPEGSGRCFYYSAIYGPYLFHSVIYARDPSPTRIIDGTMGASVSHGCVRLSLSNAKWIFDTVPSGTTVVSYNRPW